MASPDINTEDFCAAVDYLSTRDDVNPEQIGILGICGWGGMAVNAAAIDTRIKATVAATMYDMSRVNANGYFDAADNADARHELRRQLNTQRTTDYRNGSYELAGGLPDVVPDDAPQFLKDYFAYYKTERGYHKRSLNSNGGWNKTSTDRRQQGAADYPRRQPHRPLRQLRQDTVRQDRGVFPRESEMIIYRSV